MSDHVSDELLWSLDTLLQAHGGDMGDSDLGRASVYAQELNVGKDMVFGHRATHVPAMGRMDEEDEEDDEMAIESAAAAAAAAIESSSNGSMLSSNYPRRSASQRSLSEDGTDRSLSLLSEDEAGGSDSMLLLYSPTAMPAIPRPPPPPVPAPRPRASRRLSEGDQRQAPSYDDRLEASIVGNATKSLTMDEHERLSQIAARPFSMRDLAYFAPQFGRELFLAQLGTSFVEGEEPRAISALRLSISVAPQSQDLSSSSADNAVGGTVLRQGWLFKRGDVMPSWHKRWFTLRRMPHGPLLTYAKDKVEGAPTKMIDLSSTSRCMVAPKPGREHEFRLVTSADASGREFALAPQSSYEMTEWVCALQAAIHAGNKSALDGAADDFAKMWHDTGLQGFLVRYGVRKCSSRNHLQTRVLELNFAEQTITISRRGETLTSFHFSHLEGASSSSTRSSSDEHGLIIEFGGKRHKPWPLFLDTLAARDSLYEILRKIVENDVTGRDLERRCARLALKTGRLETKHAGPHATLRGKLFVCLSENAMVFYPSEGSKDVSVDDEAEAMTVRRPWYVLPLRGLHVSKREEKRVLLVGRLALLCTSSRECREWHEAVTAAMSLPTEIVDIELKERAKIRHAFNWSVARLRKLLHARVTPEGRDPPRDHATMDLLIRELWSRVFPGEPFTSNADPRWLEVGFQRGGPASDLRSSGLLGLYCLIYFATFPSREFARILKRTRNGVSTGNMKNYPFAVACINVASVLIETLGFGKAGSHSEGCLPAAMKTYAHLVAQSATGSGSSFTGLNATSRRQRAPTTAVQQRELSRYLAWEDVVQDADNHVFENMFCLLFPVLDSLFVEMGAGYMEFGQVVAAFRRRLGVIFASRPRTLRELETLANEPCTDVLLVSVPSAPAPKRKLKT